MRILLVALFLSCISHVFGVQEPTFIKIYNSLQTEFKTAEHGILFQISSESRTSAGAILYYGNQVFNQKPIYGFCTEHPEGAFLSK